jgi:outer membrane protein assembly factor BamB
MRHGAILRLALAAMVFSGIPSNGHAAGPSVTAYHGDIGRSGNFVMPGLTWRRATGIHLDPGFHAQIAGRLYAQPLYWRPSGPDRGLLIVTTEDDLVYALDAVTGAEVWKRSLGIPVPQASLPCGNIDPLGVTGTPVIDPASRAVYLDAAVRTGDPASLHHLLFGLSLGDGSVLPGWPVDVAAALAAKGLRFTAPEQNQRGALTLMDGRVFVPYGGHFGDCGNYHGWVIGVRLQDPKDLVSWSTRGRGGGIWAPGGISSDGRSLFVATGNTIRVQEWGDGEAVIRLSPDLGIASRRKDFFTPRDWRALDDTDADLGGSNTLPLDLPTRNGATPFILALGKDGKAYLLDRKNLGGLGGSVVAEMVSPAPIRTAPAMFRSASGVFVAFQGPGLRCPRQSPDNNLTVLKLTAEPAPRIDTAWCGSVDGDGSAIVTTTDGRSNPIVWILGAEGDDRLHAFRGDTGAVLSTTAPKLPGLRHFATILGAGDRLYVPADGQLYALTY